MNPFLLEMLKNYVEFRNTAGVEREQIIYWSDKDLAARLGWVCITHPRINGFKKQCELLGIIIEGNPPHGYNFRLHELRLVVNYKDLAKNYGESNDKAI